MTQTVPQPDRSDLVSDAVATADRWRRARDANRRLWRAAPIVATAALILAAAGRWAGLPPVLPLAVLGLGVIGFAIDAWMSRRFRAISDEMAARIDTDANLAGELRSAAWFAARASRNEWANFHLDRAADRVRGVNWRTLYAGASGIGVRIATSVIVIASLGLALLPTGRTPIDVVALPSSDSRPARPDRGSLSDQEPLSAELYKQFQELLAAENRTLVARQEAVSSASSNARASSFNAPNSANRDSSDLNSAGAQPQQQSKDLAERSRRAAETAMSPEVREGLEQLAENLEEAAEAADDRTQQTMASEEQARAESNRSSAESGVDEALIQFLKESAGGGGGDMLESAGSGGAGVMMMADNKDDADGRGGSGIGGGSSEDMPGAGKMPPLLALRQEVVEARADTPGQNVLTDARRKTEQGQATVTFTGSAAATFDRSRALAAPAVPEARRSSVQDYFHRK